ncbi:hypothetical protein C2E21_4979 [Chlorella sorokiniana]|uniref:NodB homology domain-containing protein n=1 Tax=Chlorella sorokiniana TaxID=3076 RepID=A0A2P6TQK8_CHLSO|nr:hypothetical protein C2E21_4979 [Chlorella sorokiniana]|eukprot:PRW56282.1 hypothetical protein C2E21_4979 [Chlorella sorokiniana]
MLAATRAAAALGLALLGLASGASGALPAWYKCDCSARDNCQCPSIKPPGGLDPKDTPQFILLTHDDAIRTATNRMYRQVCDGRTNPNGCPFRATMFTQAAETDCTLAKKMFNDGYEIATHTANHIQMPAGYPENDTVAEILGARRYLSDKCGIPADQIRGFRSPYLVTNPVVRKVLWENGFLFDSTLLETGDSESISKSFGERAWPYTMDFGIAQNCAWFADTQKCDKEERWPGLWEVPMWVLQALGLEFTMDVGFYGGRGVYDPLMAAFEQTYNGNRAPLPIFLHTTWVEKNPDRVNELERFADFTRTKKDVFWVTVSQLLDWMRNPVPASQLRLTKSMCEPREAAPAPELPQDGANVTLSFAGATQTQVASQSSRISSAVAQLLSPGVTSTPAVVALSGGPGASDSHSGAQAAIGQQAEQAQQEKEASLAVQSAPVGQPASGPFLLKDGFMQFEGPTYPSERSTLSIQSVEDGTRGSSNGDVQVVLATAGSDPRVLYEHASSPDRQEALAGALAGMGLTMSGLPQVTPILDGKALELAAPAAPAPAPEPQQTEQAQQAQQPEAVPSAPATPDATSAVAATDGSPASTTGTEATVSSDGSEPALSGGQIAGIAVGCAAAAALLTLFVWYAFRRRSAGITSTAGAGPAGSSGKGGQGTPRKAATGDEEAPSPVYNISARAQQLQASSFVNPAFAAEEGAAHNPMFEPSPVKPAEPQP